MKLKIFFRSFVFFKHPPTTEIYTLSLHDALPIYKLAVVLHFAGIDQLLGNHETVMRHALRMSMSITVARINRRRSEEHTSELQSQSNLVCRLLLEKKIKRHLIFGIIARKWRLSYH